MAGKKETGGKGKKRSDTIMDYLDWRGDLTFGASPFNEVDNLILAELSYVDFERVLPQGIGTAPVSLLELRDRYFSTTTREEVMARKSFIRMAPIMMDRMAETDRFRDLQITSYVNEIRSDRDSQMSAVTFHLPDDTWYVAFRGTDTTIVGWKEDFNFSYRNETEGQSLSVRYLDAVTEMISRQEKHPVIRVGGHSKGGNFAVYAAAFCSPSTRQSVSRVFSNDGPGFTREVTDSAAYRAVIPLVRAFIPEGSIIGVLLSSRISPVVIRSENSGAMQHDALSWEVRGTHFLRADRRTIGSLFVDQTMQRWLEKLSDEEKKTFINTLFGVLEAAGMETYSEIAQKPRVAFNAMSEAAKHLPPERQQEMKDILGKFFRSGSSLLTEKAKKKTSAMTGFVAGKTNTLTGLVVEKKDQMTGRMAEKTEEMTDQVKMKTTRLMDGLNGWIGQKVTGMQEQSAMIQAGPEIRLYDGRPENTEGRQEREIRVYDFLDRLGIRYQRTDHAPADTMAHCNEIDRVLQVVICKNLFLCNRQKTEFYLLMMPGDKPFRTKELRDEIGGARLSFAPEDKMEELLDIHPGAVSIMGLMNDRKNQVRLLMDEDVLKGEYIGCHPCVNTSSLKIRTEDILQRFLPAVHHDYTVVHLTGQA